MKGCQDGDIEDQGELHNQIFGWKYKHIVVVVEVSGVKGAQPGRSTASRL